MARIERPRHRHVKRIDQLGCRGNGIPGLIGSCGVAAAAPDEHVHLIAMRGQDPRSMPDGSGGARRVHVERQHRVDAVERTGFDHFQRALVGLFGRLKDGPPRSGPGQTSRFSGGVERQSGPQHRCGMGVVAAGVHRPAHAAAIVDGFGVLDGQCVQVGPHGDSRPGPVPGRLGDHPASRGARADVEAVGRQLLFQIPGGLRFLAAYLGMGMKMPPGLHHAVVQRIDRTVELCDPGRLICCRIHKESRTVMPASAAVS